MQVFCLGDNPSNTLKEYGDETGTGGKPIKGISESVLCG